MFIKQGCIKLFKSDSEDLMLQNIYISSKYCSLEISIHFFQILKKMYHGFENKQHLTLIIIRY